MKSCRVVYPGRRLGPIRLGGVGLGNLLFPWARALVYSRAHNIPVEWPVWSQIFGETWRRGSADKRFYGTLFKRTANYLPASCYWETRIPPFRWFREKPIRTFAEHESSAFETHSGAAALRFTGIDNYWRDLVGHHTFVWNELARIARADLQRTRARGRGRIGIHVRRGDFITRGWETSIEWFADKLAEVRRRTHKPIVVFCDEGPEAVAELLATPGVSFSKTAHHALLDMAHMAGLDGIILGNGSTFAGWAAFFGQMPIITRADKWWPPGSWAPFSRLAIEVIAPAVPSAADYDAFVESTLVHGSTLPAQ